MLIVVNTIRVIVVSFIAAKTFVQGKEGLKYKHSSKRYTIII